MVEGYYLFKINVKNDYCNCYAMAVVIYKGQID